MASTAVKMLTILRPKGLGYSLYDDFTTDESAPLTSPRTAEPGPGSWTITDASNRISISGGRVTVAAAAGTTRMVSATINRAEGLWLTAEFTGASGAEFYPLIYGRSAATRDIRAITGTAFGQFDIGDTAANYIRVLDVGNVAVGASWHVGFLLRSAGAFVFAKNATLFPAWTLLFVDGNGNSNYPITIADRSASEAFTQDYAAVRQLNAPFTEANGIASVSVSAPADGAAYTATADAVHTLTLTAPAVIATEAGLRYRITDANNYWRAYFDTAGAFKVDSVAAGTPTTRINVAGLIAGGQARTIQIRAIGSINYAWTQAGTTWTQRGTGVTLSHQNTTATIAAEVGAGWTAANLLSYPATSTTYNAL
jgi:hypothetical protein